MDLATIAQTVSAIGTVLLAALFGYQVTVFKKQVAVNRGTLEEMREGRTAHERPQVVVTAEYRHGTLVEVVISNIGRGDAKNVTFEFSAPMESSVSYRRDSEVVPLSELPHFRDGMNYLAPGAEISTVWDYHANLVPLLREMGLQPGSPTRPSGRSTRCSSREASTHPSRWARRTKRCPRPDVNRAPAARGGC